MSAFVVFDGFERVIYQDSYPPAGGLEFDPAPRYKKADTKVSAFVVFSGFERVIYHDSYPPAGGLQFDPAPRSKIIASTFFILLILDTPIFY
ncbi:hypothetical protein ACTFAO_11405 [Sphingobacterium spiritivorum]|uniref:hypothetical protein n=1 Tax=Sphingobacterium spiritivorum TaxID=258 RepID=UPI003F77145E